ncbi:sodium:proton antiporter [Pengzhenrongella sicca]|uniref:Sodium:proton antiporter n=2 Tax=Pengzhenrongella sicca TaxID=2819238 RepID=A0A8A4ZLW4_9MICO|nr:sodium:proton antiporter [Pengzhenrongella sicca]
MDRNWNELLQELRVTQTGAQILTGFLLTLPFQQRFADLTSFQRGVYLALVLLAALTTGLIVAPVSLHRVLFRRHLKSQLVTAADHLALVGLAALALAVAGTTLLVFDVVVGRVAALVAGGGVLVMLAIFWLVVPYRMARAARHGP